MNMAVLVDCEPNCGYVAVGQVAVSHHVGTVVKLIQPSNVWLNFVAFVLLANSPAGMVVMPGQFLNAPEKSVASVLFANNFSGISVM